MPWSRCLQSRDPDSELVAGIGRVKVNLKGLNHTELCPVNNQLNLSWNKTGGEFKSNLKIKDSEIRLFPVIRSLLALSLQVATSTGSAGGLEGFLHGHGLGKWKSYKI